MLEHEIIKQIVKIITTNAPINTNTIISPVLMTKGNIKELEQKNKETIDELIRLYGVTEMLKKVVLFQERLKKLDSCYKPLYMAASKSLYERLEKELLPEIYYLVFTGFINNEKTEVFASKVANVIYADPKQPRLVYNQISIFESLSEEDDMEYVYESCNRRLNIQAEVLRRINNTLTKEEIKDKTIAIIDYLIQFNQIEIQIFLQAFIKVTNEIIEYQKPKRNKKIDTRQLKLPGF